MNRRLLLTLLVVLTLTTRQPLASVAATPAAPPIDWSMGASQITTTCDASLRQAIARIAAIERSRSARTFQSVVLPLENASADVNDNLVAQMFLTAVSSDQAINDASLACANKVSDEFARVDADPQLYRAVLAASKSDTAKTVYDRKLTEYWLVTLRRSGAQLDESHRPELVKLEQQLNAVQSQFNQNLAADTTTIDIARKQTDGVPGDILAGFARNADGSYRVPVNESTAAFSADAKSEEARKAYSLAYNNRQATANTALLEKAIAIRDRLAHLLGFETWADYQLSDKMAQSPERVTKFLNNLDAAILPAAQNEVETLRQLKAKDTRQADTTLYSWDVPYYDNVLNKTTYAVDNDVIRQYFPVDHTIEAVLNVYHTLLGVNFTKITPANAWVADALEYRVDDTASGKLIGYTYFDLYPRHLKYAHFANWPLLPARRINGVMRPPVSVIVGNWPRPAPGQPALLSHSDVVTFFHEFGHNMAALLGTAPYETLSSGFRLDFVEAPSQMLENFVWDPSILKQISSNWKTGEPLPDDLIQKMVAARYVDDAYANTRQIMYASIDMTYHTSGPNVDTTAVWDDAAQRLTPIPAYPGLRPQAGITHWMSGYDAGLYAYLWSKVYAQDMFTAFQQGGLENPVVGMRYRKDILEPAQTLEPDVEVSNFLGRPMNPDAFYSEFGITPSGALKK